MSSGELVRPCARCPFRNDIEPYLPYMRAVEIAGSLRLGNMFPCHETTTHDEDTGEYIPSRDDRMCAGAAITLLKYDGPNQWMRIVDRLGSKDYCERLEREMFDAPLYEDIEEWIAAHDEAERRRVAARR